MRIIDKTFSRNVAYVSLFLFFILTSHLSAEKFKAVTTFTVIADMAQNVAGNIAIVESITKAGAEIHGYEPTPRDIVRAQDADLILWNGLNLELWFDQFFYPIFFYIRNIFRTLGNYNTICSFCALF